MHIRTSSPVQHQDSKASQVQEPTLYQIKFLIPDQRGIPHVHSLNKLSLEVESTLYS